MLVVSEKNVLSMALHLSYYPSSLFTFPTVAQYGVSSIVCVDQSPRSVLSESESKFARRHTTEDTETPDLVH